MLLSKYKKKIKYLQIRKKNKAGRNNTGRITVAHQGGGHKQIYKQIVLTNSLNQNFKNFIVGFNYDPNRTSHLAQICAISQKENFYLKTYKYILAPQNLKILDTMNNDNVNIDTNLTTKQIGNCYLLKDLNIGDFIYNIQINKYKTAQLVRAGGTFATILQKNENFATIKLPSNEIRNVPLTYTAFLGNLSNQDHIKKSWKKAGKSRWLNIRPTVRGVAKNPIDHPHGGNTSGGCHPKTPWARLTKGKPTRSKKRKNSLILKTYKK